MNKFLAVFCLAAAAWAAPEAEAEADPALLYGAYGYGGLGAYAGYAGLGAYAGYPYAYGAYAGLPYAHAIAAPAVAEVKEAEEAAPAAAAVVPTLAYAGYPYAHAVAAPVATGYAQVSPSASLSTLGLANAAVPAVAGGYAGAGRYVANSAGVVHIAKRSADADAEADADAFYGYAGYPYAGAYGAYGHLGYAGYAGYPYAYGGYASHSAAASTHIAGLAPAAAPALVGGYAAAGRYRACSAGVCHFA